MQTTFAKIDKTIWDHVTARHWDDVVSSRGLAISIALEASELLEHYQWNDKPVGSKEDLADELADILIYAFQFAHINNIDMPKAILAKLEKSGKKYPVEHFQGKSADENHKTWIKDKVAHKKGGL